MWLNGAVENAWLDGATEPHTVSAARAMDHLWQVYPGGYRWTRGHEHAVDRVRFYGQAVNGRWCMVEDKPGGRP
jgi:hypothetical protein